MEFSAIQIATLINGKLEGDPNAKVSKLAKIEEAGAGSLTFLSHPKYAEYLKTTGASVIIVSEDVVGEKPANSTFIKVKDSRQAFSVLLDAYHKQQFSKTGIEQNAVVAKSAKYGANVYIGSFSYIGENVTIGNNVHIFPNVYIGDNSKIGDGCVIYPGVKIYLDCVIGKNCKFHSGVIIGSDGFGFVPNSENQYHKMPQVGNVVIEDNVEIGSNTTIDRATMGSTVIRKGVKLDNLIQIGHNVEIGENTVIAAQSGVAGSTKIGRDCMIGGQVGIIGHITIGNGVKIAAQSGVGNDIPDGATIQGSPAFDHMDYKKSYVVFRKLPEMRNSLKDLEGKNSK
ncbi:MAG TPA: UDP-3-O-(3-hydroxymyristoyl)glucosamine N-acyltransferase [Bacteroidia bacterium]|jgi:UDP-3-O-[3-hydroxymyristoyl] glucosamine N-acyltransferase|nr:UDP-3-O-(3-hydroxymyristoyl)glucosamine N-acyltransferase [Bacteroidia bacterium]